MVVGLTAGGTLAFYAYTTYMQKFLVNTSGFTKDVATRIMAAALFVFMLLQPAVGALSDRVGRKPLMIAFGVLGAAHVPILSRIATTTIRIWRSSWCSRRSSSCPATPRSTRS